MRRMIKIMRMTALQSHGVKSMFSPVLRLDKNSLPMMITNFVCFCYLILLYIQQTIENVPYIQSITNGFLIAGAILSLMLDLIRKNKTEWLFYFVFAILSWFIVYMARSDWQYTFNQFMSTGCYMLIGLNFAKSKHNVSVYNWLLYIVLGVLLARIVIFGESFREIINFSSYNFISVLALFYLVIAVKVQGKNNVKISFKEVALFVLVTLFSYGRAGIISGVIFAVLALLLIIAQMKNIPLKIFLVVAGVVVFLSGAQKLWEMILDTGLLDKFVRLSFDTNGRSEIWSRYLNTCFENIGSFFIGGTPSFLIDGNIHNSFLQMYAIFGLPFFVTNVVIIIKMFIRDIKCKDFQSLIISVTFFVRCMTDRVLFRGYGEIAYFFIIFDYLCNEKTPTMSKLAKSQRLEVIDSI